MNERSTAVELWTSRKRSFTKEIIPYVQYMAQSGFPAFLALIGIVSILQYINLIQNVPANFPFPWIGAIVLTPLVCYSPLRTFFKEADIIYLMPMEARLGGYMKSSAVRSLRSSVLMLLAILLIYWPLYRQSSGFIGLWLLFILLPLKFSNYYFAWQERRLLWNMHRNVMRGLRWSLMFIVVMAWLTMSSPLISGVLLLSSIALLYLCYRNLRQHQFPWKRLIDEENNTLRRLYTFFNWFIDVQVMPPSVKLRNYLAWLIRLIPYRKSSTFIYLHMITFVRTEIGGICVRLLLLGGLINYMVADNNGLNGWGAVISYILFAVILSMQIGTLRKSHRHAIWKDIFPLSVGLQQQQLITIDRLLCYVLLFLLWLPTFPMWSGDSLPVMTMLLFLLGFPLLRSRRLKATLAKEEDED